MANSGFWLDGKATIVVLPSGDEGKELFHLAENWSEVGLLGPALWVEPKRVSTPEGEPVVVEAVVLGNAAPATMCKCCRSVRTARQRESEHHPADSSEVCPTFC